MPRRIRILTNPAESNQGGRNEEDMAGHIRGVFFDLGDTLLDFGHVDILSLFEAGAHLSYDYLTSLDKHVPSFAKYHRGQLWSIRWRYLISRITGREFDARTLITRRARTMGFDLTDAQVEELSWLWYEPLSRCATAESGLRQTLERLSAGRTMGIISNTFIPAATLDRHLAQMNLLDLLPIRVYSCDVRYRKPHPAIFHVALQQAGLRADQTLFVGDSLVADIAGANRVGMISVLKSPTGRGGLGTIKPKHRISRLSELLPLVDGYDAA
jgi:putative hydrolase of the HAD superfamily